MRFIRKLEEITARKLRRIFLSANKRAEYALADIEKLEKDLSEAKLRGVKEAKAAYDAAIQAAEKAQKVAQELMLEVKICEERLKQQQEIVDRAVRKEPYL